MNNNKLIYIVIILVLLISGAYWYKTRTLTNSKFKIADPVDIMPNNSPNPPAIAPPKEEPKQELKLKEIYSYQEGLAIARKLNKNIFLFFHANWCGWCNKLENESLKNPEVKELMKNYVIVYVDTDQEKEIAKKYGINELPKYFILAPNGQIIKTGRGYLNAPQFKQWLLQPAIFEN